MLSEIMFAGVPTKREPQPDRVPGISCSGLYPCPYRMYKLQVGEMYQEELTAQNVLNMSDGFDQENQAVRRLADYAKVTVQDRSFEARKVKIGKSNIPGSIDGTVVLNGKKHLWEFKAMNEDRFYRFTKWGLKTFLDYRAQSNGYMIGKSLDSCIFQAKFKDSNDYFDILVPLDLGFITPIIEWADKIRLEGWKPEPRQIPECAYCGINCFGPVIDFSWIAEAKAEDMVKKWKDGKQYQAVGGMLEDEAKAFFTGIKDRDGNIIKPGLIGDKDLLFVEDLRISKVTQHRITPNRQKILLEYGPDGLFKVCDESTVISYRISERRE